MARIFNVNQLKNGSQYSGTQFFNLKELAVQAGYTVVGSGDGGSRVAWNGVTSQLPIGEQGSGGAYDCWQTGAVRTDGVPTQATAGDAGNARAWCVLECGSGRQLLLQMPAGTTGWQGYGSLAVTRGGSSGFNPGSNPAPIITPTTCPNPPVSGAGDEYFYLGSRNSNGVFQMWDGTQNVYVHMWADTTPSADGCLPLGFVIVRAFDQFVSGHFCVVPMVADVSSADSDPCAYFGASTTVAWDFAVGPTYTRRTLNPQIVSYFWPDNGQIEPVTGDLLAYPNVYVTSTNEVYKGRPHPTSPRQSGVTRVFGFYGNDQSGDTWCSYANNYLFPWPDTATIPLP
jgi:hypothetical protein